MRPPMPSIAPATSPTPRFSVPLKSMCSWKCASPSSPGRSSAEPTFAQICNSATAARCDSRSSSEETIREHVVVERLGSQGRGSIAGTAAATMPVARDADAPPDPCSARRPSAAERDHELDLGVYVHVPFCERICPYCDFAVVRAPALARDREDAFVAALIAEFERAPARSSARRGSRRLYFGGGTPSRLRAESIARVVDAVRAALPASDAGARDHARSESEHDRARAPRRRSATPA